MNKLITSSQKHLVYHDELKEQFILLNCMSIYIQSDEDLLVLCWSKKIVDDIIGKKINKDEPWQDDERVYSFTVSKQKIQDLIEYNTYSSVSDYKKKWLDNKIERLGHKIIKHYKV